MQPFMDNHQIATGSRGRLLPLLMLCLWLLLLSGCQAMTRDRAMPDDPTYAPVAPENMSANAPVNGGIYQTTRNYNLFGDSKALNVGDVLTVDLNERTSGSKNANSSITKDNEISTQGGTLFGNDNLPLATNLTQEREFEGAADASQSNRLSGSITVSVVEVLPNGVLRVRGEKWLSLTNGEEYIRLTGLVRQEDIGSDNRVPSNRVADARMAYGGTGDFDQANQMGWLSRFFNSEWWPF
ncbi:MAG: flagellar basal body L-ring protein FlgH [Oleiphilaceae bacterium]|nr:flagellar basal body L-ring protein FlgH [Oleiphilaceae bacterium]